MAEDRPWEIEFALAALRQEFPAEGERPARADHGTEEAPTWLEQLPAN